MSVNKYQPHLLILPEDDANRQLANGFLLAPVLNLRAVQVLPPAGGWQKVLNDFTQSYIAEMKLYKNCHMLLLIDFDEQAERRELVQSHIPSDLKDRVFVLGVWSEPEKLRQLLNKSFEDIGLALAQDCPQKPSDTWNNELLKHNATEISSMVVSLTSVLFS